MPKCDTKTSKSEQCNRCFREWLGDEYSDTEVELWLYPCKGKGCGVRHLRKNMIEKVEGHYCESCAAEYEKDLLDKMTRKEETTCSGS